MTEIVLEPRRQHCLQLRRYGFRPRTNVRLQCRAPAVLVHRPDTVRNDAPDVVGMLTHFPALLTGEDDHIQTSVRSQSRVEKTAELFRFVSSMEFRQKFDSLSEANDALQASLTRERQSHQRVWTERERLYHAMGDATIEIDSRFKAILESKGKGKALRSLRPTA